MNKFLGVALVFLALVLAIAPIFSDCQSQGKMLKTDTGKTVSMKCHWAGVAEIGVAVPMAVAGLFNLRKQRKSNSQILAAVGAGSGILAILFPTVLIGVCANPSMICNLIMRPTLIAGGAIAIVLSALIFVRGLKQEN